MRSHWMAVALLFFAVGCGSNIAPVSGRITLNDKPLVNATVTYQPISDELNAGPGSHAKTDANGHYELQLMTEDTKGAIIGTHRVSITAYESGDPATRSSGSDMKGSKALVPEEYNGKSKLTFEVPAGGSTSADFALKSAPPERK